MNNTNIALVDDEKNILMSVSLILRSEGFNVTTYENGEEAIEGFEKKPPNLALLDIKMPRMNGRELLIRIRKSKNVNLKKVMKILIELEQDIV